MTLVGRPLPPTTMWKPALWPSSACPPPATETVKLSFSGMVIVRIVEVSALLLSAPATLVIWKAIFSSASFTASCVAVKRMAPLPPLKMMCPKPPLRLNSTVVPELPGAGASVKSPLVTSPVFVVRKNTCVRTLAAGEFLEKRKVRSDAPPSGTLAREGGSSTIMRGLPALAEAEIVTLARVCLLSATMPTPAPSPRSSFARTRTSVSRFSARLSSCSA